MERYLPLLIMIVCVFCTFLNLLYIFILEITIVFEKLF